MSAVLDAVGQLASPWAYVVIGLLATAESAAFVGLVIPVRRRCCSEGSWPTRAG